MSHARNVVRLQFEEIITGMGMTVYNDTALPVTEGNIPAVVLDFSSESIDNDARVHDPKEEWTQKRMLTVLLTVLALDPKSRDDLCSTLEAKVAQAGQSEKALMLQGTDFETSGEANQTVFSAEMSFEVTYLTLNTKPSEMLA